MPKHTELNLQRSEQYRKSPEEENFLERFNEELLPLERSHYNDEPPEHPFLFVIGLPRSGTTLLTQVIAHCLETGFVNNLAARFWKAPVTGIRFARAVLDKEPFQAFQSHYGATDRLKDIHEFGYFWREKLNKDDFASIKNAPQTEEEIDWEELRASLAAMQREFGKPMVFKNIFGSYHMPRLNEELNKTLWIWIRRAPLDTAVSILDARRKYYDDPSHWWSYVPPRYEEIIDEDYWTQIAGQVHYLDAYYRRQFETMGEDGPCLTLSYEELCADPAAQLERIRDRLEKLYGRRPGLAQQPPSSFDHRTYEDRDDEKQKFESILKTFADHE